MKWFLIILVILSVAMMVYDIVTGQWLSALTMLLLAVTNVINLYPYLKKK